MKKRKIEEGKALASLWQRLAENLAEMQERNPSAWEPPADMERRRLAALERYKWKNPSYMEVTADPPQLQENRNRKSRSGKPTPVGLQVKYIGENRWSLQTTLELLDEVKAFLRTRRVQSVGGSNENWKVVAAKLSNPCGMEPGKFARSCQVKFENIRRRLKSDNGGRVEGEVRESMADYDQIRAAFATTKNSLGSRCAPETRKETPNVSTDNEVDILDCSRPGADAAEPQPAECHQRLVEDKERPSLSSPSVVSEGDEKAEISGPVMSKARLSGVRMRGIPNRSTRTSARKLSKSKSDKSDKKQNTGRNECEVRESKAGRVGSPGTPSVTKVRPMRVCRTRRTLT